MNDFPTPKTDALIERLFEGSRVPVCPEWGEMVEHARELERLTYAYQAVATTCMREVFC